jgi:plastocyanin
MSARIIIAALVLAGAVGCGQSSTNPASPTPTPNPTPAPSPSPSPSSSTSVSVVPGAQQLTSTAYNPNPVNVAVGAAVTWTNTDSIEHTTTSNNGTWNGVLPPGGTVSVTFNNAGTFQYHCSIHPNMVGTVVVQ